MKKKIIVPTDFTVESLNSLRWLLQNSGIDQKLDIILLHGASTPDSITEMLFFSKSRYISELQSQTFRDACALIRNKYDGLINSLRTDLFTGFTQSAFDAYLEGNNVTSAVIPSNYKLTKVTEGSIDILPFIRNSRLTSTEVEWDTEELLPEKGKLAEVFYIMQAG